MGRKSWITISALIWLIGITTMIEKAESAQECTKPNDCYEITGYPYCVRRNAQDAVGKCSECDPNIKAELGFHGKDCQCPVNAYCGSNPKDNSTFATCVPFPYDKLGSPCILGLKAYDLQFTVNDEMFCGVAAYDGTNRAYHIDWEGVCTKGRCRFCAIDPLPSLPASYCPDGRSCLPDNTEGYAFAGIFSWTFWRVNPFITVTLPILLLVFLIFITLVTYTIAWFRREKGKHSHHHSQGDYQTLADS